MANSKDYPYIRAWCERQGSYNYYITDEINRARQDNAPQDALYPIMNRQGERTGEWATFSKMRDENPVKHYIEAAVQAIRAGI